VPMITDFGRTAVSQLALDEETISSFINQGPTTEGARLPSTHPFRLTPVVRDPRLDPRELKRGSSRFVIAGAHQGRWRWALALKLLTLRGELRFLFRRQNSGDLRIIFAWETSSSTWILARASAAARTAASSNVPLAGSGSLLCNARI